MANKITKELLYDINNAWLRSKNIDESFLINPLNILRVEETDEFQKRLAWLLMQPEYFSFLCKHIMNIELLPMQAMILCELWNRKFPMFIGTRGLGKTFILSLYCLLRAFLMPNRKVVVVGAAFRQSKFLHEYMETIWKNAPILRDLCDSDSGPSRQVDMCRMTINGSTINAIPIGDGCQNGSSMITSDNCFCSLIDNPSLVYGNNKEREVDYFIDNGVKPTKIVTTKKGYSYEGTYNHAMKIYRDGEIIWGRTDEMKIGDLILIDRSIRWHNGNFDCSEEEAYSLGAMIGDGCWTNKYKMGFATKDQEIIDVVNKGIEKTCGKPFSQCVSDAVHWNLHSMESVSLFCDFWNLKENCYTIDKTLPSTILSASRDKMTACLQGLFDTDGHLFTNNTKGGTTISVHFTNTSKKLVEQIQYILLHYGIISSITSRQRKNWNRCYELGIYGTNVKLFAENINFRLSRKRDALNKAVLERKRWVSIDDVVPIPAERSRKTTQIAYAIKNINKFSNYAHLINQDYYYDKITSITDSECHTYDIHVPDGNEYCSNGFFSHNSKIRGLRANDIISDEFASMSRDIFENVIAGFGMVTANPTDNVRREAAKERAKELGVDPSFLEVEGATFKANQIVISGTAYYDFNHFAEYWKKWKKIIASRGRKDKIIEIMGGEEPDPSFDWRDYSIMRIPYNLVPKGFLDAAQIARSKATVHNGIFLMEYSAVFATDSQGFFKRTLIESCVGTDTCPINLPSGPIYFDAMLKGNANKKYVIGVDPASEVDNFAIVVLELNPDHRKIVHCWTTNRKDHMERVAQGIAEENNYYSYCARKIRDLMGRFNIVYIAMDSQGGGYPISEALHDITQLRPGENLIWPIIEEDKEKPSDDQPGLHIIELCNFAKAEWTGEANHGLRKDFEDKITLFPRFDPITLGISAEQDTVNKRSFDTLEDCVMDIEELKHELSLIEISQTPSGRDRWDTPEVKVGVGKKQRMRKDRYSALLMANMAARSKDFNDNQPQYMCYGGFAQISSGGKKEEVPGYIGPNWFTSQMKDTY